jgi:hypothetical protein
MMRDGLVKARKPGCDRPPIPQSENTLAERPGGDTLLSPSSV